MSVSPCPEKAADPMTVGAPRQAGLESPATRRPSQPTATSAGTTAAPRYDQLLERVRYDGMYPTRERAEATVRTVLTALGRQLTAEDRFDLAARLPGDAGRALTAAIPEVEALSGRDFVGRIAVCTGGTNATARWDAGTVLTEAARLAGDDLIDRILARLPSGYALLLGRAELVRSA